MFFTPRYKYGEITQKWGDAKVKKEYDKKIESWLNQFTDKEKPIILELLKNYRYYTESAVAKKVVELHRKFLESNGEDISRVLFTKIPKEYGVANSDLMFNAYWLNNDIYSYSSNDVIREFLENDAIPQILVIVDDYVGTGETFITTLKRMIEIAPELLNRKIYFLTLHASLFGVEEVNKFTESLSLDFELIYLEATPKAFLGDYIFLKADVQAKQDEYSLICQKKRISSDYIFGYNDVQSLVSFNNTTPNNTLGLFWYNDDNYISLFKKTIKKRNTSVSDLKGIARKNSHRDVVLFGIEDNQYNKFIVYCVKYGMDFSFSKACEDFGITMDLLRKRIDYVEKMGYIKIKEGKIIPTKKTNERIIKNRIKNWDIVENQLKEEKKIPLIETNYIPRNFNRSFSGYKK